MKIRKKDTKKSIKKITTYFIKKSITKKRQKVIRQIFEALMK